MDYQIVLSTSARKDIREIVRYISTDAPQRALAFGQYLISKTKMLAQNPGTGRVVPEFDDPEIREIIVKKYRVIYQVDHALQKVKVVRFWHSARNIPELPIV